MLTGSGADLITTGKKEARKKQPIEFSDFAIFCYIQPSQKRPLGTQ